MTAQWEEIRSILEPFALGRDDVHCDVAALKRHALALIQLVDEARRRDVPTATCAAGSVMAFHHDCVVCRAGSTESDLDAAEATLTLLLTLESVPLEQVRRDLCFKHREMLKPTPRLTVVAPLTPRDVERWGEQKPLVELPKRGPGGNS